MATLTVVITYSGTLGTDPEVTSYTSGGTAFASLTAAELKNTAELLLKAHKATFNVYREKTFTA